jgi:hypothetical protein
VAWPTAQLTNAAVAAYGADLVLDDASEITGAENAHGLLAVGGLVTVTGVSLISENEGYGIALSAGASVTVGGGTGIEVNGAGGIAGTGHATHVHLSDAEVYLNLGPGVHVTDGATGSFEPAYDAQYVVEVVQNEGGLSATGGGVLNAGLCDRPGCGHIPHELIDNELGGYYDARSLTGSTLFAEGDYWGPTVDDPSDLVLVQDGSCFLSVEPIATTPGVPFTERLAGPPGWSTGNLARGSGQTAVALIAEAERLLVAGDTTSAGGLVVDALTGVAADTSATEDDRRAAFRGGRAFPRLHAAGPRRRVARRTRRRGRGAPAVGAPRARRRARLGRGSGGGRGRRGGARGRGPVG